MFSPREITISTTMLHWSIFRLLFDLCVPGEVLLHFLITLVVSLSVNLITEMICCILKPIQFIVNSVTYHITEPSSEPLHILIVEIAIL